MTTTVIRIHIYKIQKALYFTATGIRRCTIQKALYMAASIIRRYSRQKALYVTTNGVRMHMFWNTEVFVSGNRWHTQVYSENGLHVITTRIKRHMRQRLKYACMRNKIVKEIASGINR